MYTAKVLCSHCDADVVSCLSMSNLYRVLGSFKDFALITVVIGITHVKTSISTHTRTQLTVYLFANETPSSAVKSPM